MEGRKRGEGERKCGGTRVGRGWVGVAMKGLSGSSKYLYCSMIRARVKERERGERQRNGWIESVHPFINSIPDP